jgi:hypothetical protein
MDRGRYAVDAVVIEGRSLRSVASALDMSKSWVAKQVTLFRAGGYEALAPKSKAPHRRPTQLDGELENEIVMIRKQLGEAGFDAGPLTIQYHLRQRHGTAPPDQRSTGPWSGAVSLSRSRRNGPASRGNDSRRRCRTRRGRPT